MAAPFPTTQRPFPRLELTEQDCRRFHTQATELLGKALSEYEEHALARHRQVDRRRWKTVKTHENLTVYRESRSYVASRSLSVEDEESFARAAAMAPSNAPMRRRSSRSSSSSGGSGGSNSGSVSRREPPVHQVTELELLTGWGPTATEVREQKKRAKNRSNSATANLDHLPMLLGVGSVIGSLDDVMFGVAAPDCASMALKAAYSHEDVLDGDVLCAIEGPSQRSPFRFLGIKWLVKATGGTKQRFVSPRDLVYLEATGVITRGDGVRVGYQVMHSVDLAGCPELLESHDLVRSRCESVHLFVEINDKMVDVYMKAKVTPNGRISESAALQSCANSLLYVGKTVQCSQSKKLSWRLECSGDKRPVRRNINGATQCSICSKSFGRFHRQGGECKLCHAAMCSKCCVERTLKNVDATGNRRHTCKFVTTRVVELCTGCIAITNQDNAMSLAREQVMSGRFGRVAKGSPLPPGLRRGSSDPNALTNSIATIRMEDLPGHHDRMTHPPMSSESGSRRAHRPHRTRLPSREESERSYREQRAYREDPLEERGYQPQYVYADPETSSRRAHQYREVSAPIPSSRGEPRLRKLSRERAGSRREAAYHGEPVSLRRGHSDPVYSEMSRAKDNGDADRYDAYSPQKQSYSHRPVYRDDESLKLDSSGRGGNPLLYEVDEMPRDESMGKATSSSSSSLAEGGISLSSHSFGSRGQPEAESEIDEARDTFDSFGDLIAPLDDLEDVDEMLDTRDMQAVLRRSQYNRKMWQRMADLRDAAENVYQYTKASPAAQMAAKNAPPQLQPQLPEKW